MTIKSGFTLMELLVVIAIITLLAGLIFPVASLMKKQAKVTNTRALVRAVSTAITAYQSTSLSIRDAGESWTYPIWDWNRDHLIDAKPEIDVPGIESLSHPDHRIYVSGYAGFWSTVRPELPKAFVTSGGVIVDAWNQRLRIANGKPIFGPLAIGVWSIGPDGKDDGGISGDDLAGWEAR